MNKVILGDNMKYMKSVPDNYFELAIVDPPYGIKQDGHRENNRSKNAKSKDYHKALWDQLRPTSEYFQELKRISKNQIIWGGNHLSDLINEFSPCWIVWDKHTSGNFADCELAYTSFKTAVRKFDYPWNGMIQGFHGSKSKNEARIHPTQKPVALYKWLLKNYAKPNDKIFDSHVGSGSIRIACHDMGFDFTGCEIDEDYYNDQDVRFKNYIKQGDLFSGAYLQKSIFS